MIGTESGCGCTTVKPAAGVYGGMGSEGGGGDGFLREPCGMELARLGFGAATGGGGGAAGAGAGDLERFFFANLTICKPDSVISFAVKADGSVKVSSVARPIAAGSDESTN